VSSGKTNWRNARILNVKQVIDPTYIYYCIGLLHATYPQKCSFQYLTDTLK